MMKTTAFIVIMALTAGSLRAQESRESQLEAEPFRARVQHVSQEFGDRQKDREKRVLALEAVAARKPELRGLATITELRVRIEAEQDLIGASTDLLNLYAAQSQRVDQEAKRTSQFAMRREAQVADLSAELTNLGARASDLRTTATNAAFLTASPESNDLLARAYSELARVVETRSAFEARIAKMREEIQWAGEDKKKLQDLSQALRKKAQEYAKAVESAKQVLVQLADRMEFLITHDRTDLLVSQTEQGLSGAPTLSLGTLEDAVFPEPTSANELKGKEPVDIDKLRECIQQGGKPEACGQEPGGRP